MGAAPVPPSQHLPGARGVTEVVAKVLQGSASSLSLSSPSYLWTGGISVPGAPWQLMDEVGSCAVGGVSADEQNQFLVEIC